MALRIYFSILSIAVFALSTSAYECACYLSLIPALYKLCKIAHSSLCRGESNSIRLLGGDFEVRGSNLRKSIFAYICLQDSTKFGYAGPNGPEKWGSLSPSYLSCSNGKAQSPVDLAKADVVWNKQLKSLDKHYIPTNATLVNNKFNLGVHFEAKVGDINIDRKNYSLKQLHWHSPSEHQANGRIHDAELHLVHLTEDNNYIAVLAVLYKLGDADPIISKIEDKLIDLEKQNLAGHKDVQIALGTFDLNEINKRTHRYYRYVGSLTTPPCKEGITWNILGKVRTLSKKQLELLKAPLDPECKHNARPIQPLNGRKIEMYYKPKHA